MPQTDQEIDRLLDTLKKAKKTMEGKRRISYCVSIPEDFFNRIDRHVRLLKALESKDLSKNGWMEDAIATYIKTPTLDLKKTKPLNVQLTKSVNLKIDDLVNQARKEGGNLNKKDIVVDAIEAKLQKESKKAAKLLKEATHKKATEKQEPQRKNAGMEPVSRS